MKILTLILFLCFLLGCSLSKEKIIKSKWKYKEGFYIGDVIYFDSNKYFTIDDSGKIYKQGLYIAKVNKSNGRNLEIKSKENVIGYYISI